MKSRKPYANSRPRSSATLDTLRRIERDAKQAANDAARRRRKTHGDEAPEQGSLDVTDETSQRRR